jgi:nitrate reductase gamma subunit
MYEFARGPLVWIAFAILIGGSIYRLVSTILLAKKEKVILPYMTWKHGLRSIIQWILPFGTHNWRIRPSFTVLTFLFHLCLLITPILTLGHVLLWKESWNIDWWALPSGLSTLMTIIVILGGILFFMRRIADPTVRFVSSWSDFVLVIIVLAPFVTGFMAHQQICDYKTIITIHMISGALWLAIIPFTRIVHMIFFPLTRAYMGGEFGFVRGARDW